MVRIIDGYNMSGAGGATAAFLPPQAVLFDWDGTLVDSVPSVLAAHNYVRQQFNLPLWELSWFKLNMGRPARSLYPEIYGEQADEAIDMLYQYIDKTPPDRLKALPGAAALLSYLYDSGVAMAVISNKKHEYLLREISHMQWDHYFFTSLGSGIINQDKPSAAPILKVLHERNLTPQEILYVGDTETDLKAAHAGACPCALVLNGDNKDSIIEQYRPHIIVNDCAVLQKYFCKNIEELAKIKTC